MAEDYLTVAELATTLSLGGETFADADLALAITAASRDVERRTGRKFWLDSATRYYYPSGSCRVWIDDAKTVSSVEQDTGLDGTFSETWTLDTDYILEPLNASAEGEPFTAIKLTPRTSKVLYPDARIRVAGQFGWAAVPDEVVQATTILAARLVKRTREAPFGVAGFGIDGGAVRVSSVDPDVDALLAGLVRTNFT